MRSARSAGAGSRACDGAMGGLRAGGKAHGRASSWTGHGRCSGTHMPREPGRAPVFGSRFIRHLSHLVGVYWRSTDAPWGAFLLAIAVIFELWTVWGSVRVADAEREILDALARREAPAFLAAVAVFLTVTLLYLFSSAY